MIECEVTIYQPGTCTRYVLIHGKIIDAADARRLGCQEDSLYLTYQGHGAHPFTSYAHPNYVAEKLNIIQYPLDAWAIAQFIRVKLGADLLETSEFPGNGRYAHNAGYQNIKQTRRAAAATARERTCDIMMKVPILVKIPKNMLNKIAQGVEVTMTAKTNAWAPRQIIQTTMGPFTIESHKEEVELIITFKRDKRRRVR